MTSNGWLTAEKPLLIGHRGASLALPENTLAAFALAVEQGADGVELDVQLSADGQPAIFHDRDLRRLNGSPRRVAELEASELRREALDQGQTVPMLPDLFATLGDQTLYNIELKGSGFEDRQLVDIVAACVREYGVQHLALISSFSPWLVRRAQEVFEPDSPVALLREPGVRQYSKWLVATEVDNPHYSLVTAESMQTAVRQGRRVFTWTVDDPALAQELLDLGVNGIITNDPGQLRHHVCLPEQDVC